MTERHSIFEFRDGCNKEFVSGPKALITGSERGWLSGGEIGNPRNGGDRGSLSVSLFDLHKTEHFFNSQGLRERLQRESPEMLTAMAQALVDDVISGKWTGSHAFIRALMDRDDHLLQQLASYGVILNDSPW